MYGDLEGWPRFPRHLKITTTHELENDSPGEDANGVDIPQATTNGVI